MKLTIFSDLPNLKDTLEYRLAEESHLVAVEVFLLPRSGQRMVILGIQCFDYVARHAISSTGTYFNNLICIINCIYKQGQLRQLRFLYYLDRKNLGSSRRKSLELDANDGKKQYV